MRGQEGNMVTVVFFASLKEKLKCDRIHIEFIEGLDLTQLKRNLMSRNVRWKEALSNEVMVSVNHELVNINMPLEDGAEVAFFPPVTGG